MTGWEAELARLLNIADEAQPSDDDTDKPCEPEQPTEVDELGYTRGYYDKGKLPPVMHFGERLRRTKLGLKMSRDSYLPDSTRVSVPQPFRFDMSAEAWERTAWRFTDDSRTFYSDEYAQVLREEALRNFDLNLAYFRRTDRDGFDSSIADLLRDHPEFQRVTDLTEWDRPGVYTLVLGGYSQVYIGQSTSIRRRVRQHWTIRKPLDRLVFGDERESTLSIAAFRPLDTTRILAAPIGNSRIRDRLERTAINSVPARYRLNRVDGGLPRDAQLWSLLAERPRNDLTSE